MTRAGEQAPRAEPAVGAAAEAVLALRRADGGWTGTLPPSAVSTGAAVFALAFADPDGSAAVLERAARWLRQAREPDGGWADFPGGPSTVNATAIAVAALRLCEPERSDAHVRTGLAWLEHRGGVDVVADKRRCTLKAVCEHYLALAGLYDPARLARMPVELLVLPRALRQKLSFTVPGLAAWGVMQARTWRFGPVRRAVNRLAEPAALRYLRAIHDYEGPEGGVEESPLMVAIVCLGLHRAGRAPDLVAAYRDYLHATVRRDGAWAIDRDIECSVTGYLVPALAEAGLRDDPRLAATRQWIQRCQRAERFPATGCPAGGWGWSVPSGWPETDDTAGAVLALTELGVPPGDPGLRRGVAWLLTMQNRNGSWSCFARDTPSDMDAPCTVLTAHALLALRRVGAGTAACRRAVRWLTRTQRPDGSFGCVWFRDHTAGTARALEALGALGLADSAAARGARDWLLRHQRDDGGWGDGHGAASTAEETAWAVLGLLRTGERAASERGVRWLLAARRADGLWDAAPVGFYFLELTYWCDHIPHAYALQALARYRTEAGCR
ncbi:squalene-hopene/tetraprenyl-beta-curcumene cyclase [Prauserella shujinwangii]|uniref:Squalene-hopene/tetraprenyl-beta-curcumene cyclase n=1 Tax=Prauserella shujinwangii TaxID=1453103 RepID=A0A2T0LSJ8_9PSEU|nr:prenyltransferase/squalene oxidase repeat-containing protein [Prauserella shujinwangii]PRX46636.1 squalene-hopene/tetraprenyl-beta-curcumene cyclase [Prauserella shujinwangii]